MPSCLSGYFAVMLRQAALAVPVAYQAISLRNCSDDCASRRPPRKRQRGLPARLSAGVSVLTEKKCVRSHHRALAFLAWRQNIRDRQGRGYFAVIASASACGSGCPAASAVQSCCEAAVFICLSAQGKAPVFLKTGALSKGAQPLYDYIWRFFRHQPQSCLRGRGVRKTARKSARYQANSGN